MNQNIFLAEVLDRDLTMVPPARSQGQQTLERSREKEQRSLKIALMVTAGIMVVEVFGGILSNSLALLSDAWHMFTDTSALALCFLAGRLSLKPPSSDKTFGYHRVEILSALANGATLVGVALLILYQAVSRMLFPAEVKGLEMLVIAAVGLAANLFSMTILSKGMLSLNVKSAFLHVAGDALSSVGVVVAGVVIFFTNWYFLDPIMSISIGSIIIYGAARMLKEVLHILLEGVPSKIKVEEVVSTIRSIHGVRSVHDTHIWSITSYMHYLSAHLVVGKKDWENIGSVLNEVKQELDTKYRIRHTTLQVEPEGYEEVGEVHS